MKKLRHFLPTIGASIGVLAFAAAAAAAPALIEAQEETTTGVEVEAPEVVPTDLVPTELPLPDVELPDVPKVELPDVPKVELPDVPAVPDVPDVLPEKDADDVKPAKVEQEEGEAGETHGACVSRWTKEAKLLGLKGKSKGRFISSIARDKDAKGASCDFGDELEDALKAQADTAESRAAGKAQKSKPKPEKTHSPEGEESGS
jgi:hypothetical protein